MASPPSPPPMDPETFLRLSCERLLLSGDAQRNPFVGNELAVVGQALVAAGALGAARAEAVLDDYRVATAVRTDRPVPFGPGRPGAGRSGAGRSPQRQRFTSARVVFCSASFADPEGTTTVESVWLSEERTRLELSGVVAGGGVGARRMRPFNPWRASMPGLGRRTLTVKDDHGTVTTASPGSGSSGGGSWQSEYVTNVALDPTTRWIEIEGTQIDLPPALPSPPVRLERLEPLEPLEPLERYEGVSDLLRQVLYPVLFEVHRPRPGGSGVSAALEALVATGVIAEDDPLHAELADAEAKLVGGAGGSRSGGSRSGGPGSGSPRSGGRRPLPAGSGARSTGNSTGRSASRWAEVVARIGRVDGRKGTMAIGAALDLGDFALRVDSLTSEEDGFAVAVAVSPGGPLLFLRHQPFAGPALAMEPLSWWASDDLGNTYYGAPTSSGGSEDVAEGVIHYLPPLDPKATELQLLPTVEGERAVITLNLGLLSPPERRR